MTPDKRKNLACLAFSAGWSCTFRQTEACPKLVVVYLQREPLSVIITSVGVVLLSGDAVNPLLTRPEGGAGRRRRRHVAVLDRSLKRRRYCDPIPTSV